MKTIYFPVFRPPSVSKTKPVSVKGNNDNWFEYYLNEQAYLIMPYFTFDFGLAIVVSQYDIDEYSLNSYFSRVFYNTDYDYFEKT